MDGDRFDDFWQIGLTLAKISRKRLCNLATSICLKFSLKTFLTTFGLGCRTIIFEKKTLHVFIGNTAPPKTLTYANFLSEEKAQTKSRHVIMKLTLGLNIHNKSSLIGDYIVFSTHCNIQV